MAINLSNLEFASGYIYCTRSRGWSVRERRTNKTALGGVRTYTGGKTVSYQKMAREIRDYIIPRLNAWLESPDFTIGTSGVIDLGVTTDIQSSGAVEVYTVGIDGEIEGDIAHTIVRHDNGTDRDARLVAHLTAVRDVLAAKFG